MEDGLFISVGVSALVLGYLIGQMLTGAPQWLQAIDAWKKGLGDQRVNLPYPSIIVFCAVQAKGSYSKSARPDQTIRDRAELQGWTYWDEPFQRALQAILATLASLLALTLGLSANLGLALTLAMTALLGLAAWLDPPRRLHSRYRSTTENCLDGMPSLLDGLVIALEAGQSLSRSLEVSLSRGYRRGDEAWVAATRQALEDIRRGLGVEPAFARLRRVLPIPVIHRFAASCVLGETQGQSIAGVLKRQAEQCRREAHMAIEKRALQAPVKLMAPLMICIFPCTFLILLAPLSRTLLSVGGA